ncbi:MAG: hypothetical protein ABS88_00075 [Sphingopyxis sp. SCN 67-31]|nr:MAG: hypothetical protein ABS88_00075 [Sphingopyxis sp. SCN 67-31]
MDERVWRSMGPNQTISDMTVCDLPLSIGDDGSDAPFYALKVAEGPDFVPQLDEPSHESSDDRH